MELKEKGSEENVKESPRLSKEKETATGIIGDDKFKEISREDTQSTGDQSKGARKELKE